MIEVTFVRATTAHASELAPRLRQADLAEVLAGGNASALEALETSLAVSDFAFAALFDGEVAVLFGVAPYRLQGALGSCSTGLVWALTGDLVARYPMTFFRHSKPILEALQRYCAHLVTWIDARYTGALRWAAHLGFTIDAPAPRGPSGLPFCFVSLRRA